MARGGPDITNYWAGPSPDGTLWIGNTVDGQINVGGTFNYYDEDHIEQILDNEQVLTDIHIRFDGVDNQFSVYAWWDGDEQPSEPQLTFEDDDYKPEGDIFEFIVNASSSIGFAFDVRYLAVLPFHVGDFNGTSDLDLDDIDLLSDGIRATKTNRVFDLNENLKVDHGDLQIMIRDLHNTYFGDANLDGEFNSTDFVQVFEANEYEDDVEGNSTWSTGDWNADGEFDSKDFVFAFQDGGYEKGPRPAAVPEPKSWIGIPLTLWLLSWRRACSR